MQFYAISEMELMAALVAGGGKEAEPVLRGIRERKISWKKESAPSTSTNKPMPKLPTLEEVYASIQCGPYCDLSYRERHVLEACHEFIGRQLSA
jgi:hypothetical protein